MSLNNDDVLDNWEEIDEVSLNTKLSKLKKESAAKMNSPLAQQQQHQLSVQQPQQQLHNGKQQPMNMLLMHNNDDDYRTQYGPTEPQVKILKRPTLNSSNKSLMDAKPKAPMKTLQQREHEYAQARLRIMGSAQSPDDNTDVLCRQNGVINAIRNATTCSQTQSQQQQSVASSYTLANGSLSSSLQTTITPTSPQSMLSSLTELPTQMLQRPQDGVIRLPRGPNGTTGFTIRR